MEIGDIEDDIAESVPAIPGEPIRTPRGTLVSLRMQMMPAAEPTTPRSQVMMPEEAGPSEIRGDDSTGVPSADAVPESAAASAEDIESEPLQDRAHGLLAITEAMMSSINNNDGLEFRGAEEVGLIQ